MSTMKICDHCNTVQPQALRTSVSVLFDGIALEGQSTGYNLEADICPTCRAAALPKMLSCAMAHVEQEAPYHKLAIENRFEAARLLTEVRVLQDSIGAREENPSPTILEKSQIELKTAQAAVLENEAAAALVEATQISDAMKAW